MKRNRRIIAFLLTFALVISAMISGEAAVFAAGGQKNLLQNGSFEDSHEPSKSLDGWQLGEGFTVVTDDVKEGVNALKYVGGAEGTAKTDDIALAKKKNYIVSAWIKKSAQADVAKIALDGTDIVIEADGAGAWVYYSKEFSSGDLEKTSITLTAKGDVLFDEVNICEVYDTAIELVKNGDFENGTTGWSGGTTSDATAIGGEGMALNAAIINQSVSVEKNTWYIYSADIYRYGNGKWTYIDMYPTAENMRLRGHKVKEWEHLAGLWYSGSNTSTTVRIVTEGNWDNATSSINDGSKAMVDNVSLVKADVQENLIPDPDFSLGQWELNENAAIATNKGKSDKYSFKSAMSAGTAGDAIAVANGGKPIAVTPNTQYVFSAWVYLTGAPKTATAYIDMNDAEGEVQLESTTYNHDGYKDDYWILMSGFWYSGSHTEITVRAVVHPETDGTVNTAYIDEVSLRQAAITTNGDNLVKNGTFEGYYTSYHAENWKIENGASITDDAYVGKKALLLSDDAAAATSDNVAIAANTDYILTGWVKALSGATAQISALDGDVKINTTKQGEWERVSTVFNSGSARSTSIKLNTTGGAAIFDGLYLDKASNYYEQDGTVLSENAERTVLSSADTSMTIAIDGDKQYIEELTALDTGHKWITPAEAQEMPLVGAVNGKATDWKYAGKEIDEKDGKLLKIKFTNADPAMELTAYWQAYPGENGPIQYWAEIENKSGETLTFKYADIVSGDIVLTADSQTTLTYFEKRSYTGSDMTSKVYEEVIDSGFEHSSNVTNVSVWNGNHRLPFQLLQTSSGQGLYYGYYWSFGDMTVETQDDPLKIRVKATLGSSGNVTRKLDAGDKDGDGVADADDNLVIPGMFFGAYKGSIDNGSNRMKSWYWNHRMTKTMRENENEPLVELHLPFNSEEEWTTYLSEHDVASWGVQLLKQDYWWTVPNSPPSDGSFVPELQSKWNPYPTKWPNGMILGDLAHSYGMKMTLYMCQTYEDTSIADWNGRSKNLGALKYRLKEWNIDYYRSDFNLEGPDATNNYASHEGFMWVLDQLINDSELPNFRYEHCSGGGALKDFTSLERMTFMTTEDSGRALAHRNVAYADSYMINPVQLKVDNSIDWPPLEGTYSDQNAWDYYSLRTGLMGAMMVCPSTTLSGFTDHQIEVAKETYAIYNAKQRQILRNCDVYHILPSPDGVNWDGLEYYNEKIGMGSIVLFRPGKKSETEKVIYPDGLKAGATYEVTFEDNTDLNVTATGEKLMKDGILVRMDKEYDSEIVWLKEKTQGVGVEKIEIRGTVNMKLAETAKLLADITPINASNCDVIWLSSDNRIASVNAQGYITSHKPGKVTITARATDGSGIEGSVEVTVTEKVSDDAFICVNDTDESIKYGAGSGAGSGGGGYINGDETIIREYAEFTFEGTMVRVISATNVDLGMADIFIDGQKITTADWYSSSLLKQQVVFESAMLDPGKHTIKIVPTNTKNSLSTGTLIVVDAFMYLKDYEAAAVVLEGPDTVKIGQTAQYTAAILPEEASQKIVWSVTPVTGEATIDENGLLTAVKAGKVTVRAASDANENVFDEITVTIENIGVESMKILNSPNIYVGEAVKLDVGVYPENATNKAYEAFVMSGDAAIIDGALKANSVGTIVVVAISKDNGSIGAIKQFTATVRPKVNISKLKVKLAATLYTYDGKVKKPAVTVTDANGKKIASSNYTVTYASGRKLPGTYTVKVTMKGSYTGSKTLTFAIRGKQMTVSKLTALSKVFKATWKKQSYVTGYQVQYSTSSKFTAKTTKTATISKYTTTSKTVTKLKASTKYYVRVRSYKTTKISGKNYNVYSAWSKAKAVTTKK